jgi:5-methylcytosine-specific restriction endonuclease McrA
MQQRHTPHSLTTFPSDGPKNFKYCSEVAQASLTTTRKEGELCPTLIHVNGIRFETDRISLLQSKIRSLDRQDREQSVVLLSRYPEAIPLLIEALDDSSPIVRKHALLALGHHHAYSTVEHINQLSSDEDPAVRSAVNSVLEVLSPPSLSSVGGESTTLSVYDSFPLAEERPHKNIAVGQTEKNFPIFSQKLSNSAFTSIKATLQHLQSCIRSNNYYTSYLSPDQIDRNHAVTTHNGRALRFGCQGTLTNEDFDNLFLNWDGICYWCSEEVPSSDTHVDHYIPLSRLGPNIPENLVIACSDCNLKKNAKDPLEFAQLIGKTESETKLIKILSAAKIERLVYEQHRSNKPKYDPVTRIVYIENYAAFVFAPTFFDDRMLGLYREVPHNKRVFHKFSSFAPLNTYWLVDEPYAHPLINGIEKLGGRIAFIIPEYSSKKFKKPIAHPGFDRATLHLFRGKD